MAGVCALSRGRVGRRCCEQENTRCGDCGQHAFGVNGGLHGRTLEPISFALAIPSSLDGHTQITPRPAPSFIHTYIFQHQPLLTPHPRQVQLTTASSRHSEDFLHLSTTMQSLPHPYDIAAAVAISLAQLAQDSARDAEIDTKDWLMW